MVTQAVLIDLTPGFTFHMGVVYHIPRVEYAFFLNDWVDDQAVRIVKSDMIFHTDRCGAKTTVLIIDCRDNGAKLSCFKIVLK